MIQPQADAKGVQLCVECDAPPDDRYVGDERGVRQILANLLSNALKFTPRGGEIALRCGQACAPAESDTLAPGERYVVIAVSDTGIGIEPHDLPRLFQPFTQLEARDGNPYTRPRGGAGLGLSISRELAHLMGGDITVESVVDHGSTFTVWLPAAAA
jgi:signal transduction histidine kinase